MTSGIAAWQRTLLPFMICILVAAALFFAWQSVWEYADFKHRVMPPKTDLSTIFERFETSDRAGSVINTFDYFQWKSLISLEQETIRHRYAQVNATILARVWTRLMGFTTGMVLAIVGAAFILGKLREPQTELKQETEALKVSLATSSPGIVLAVLGTFLMSITLLTRFDIDVRDVPVYVAGRAASPGALPDPTRLILPERKAPPETSERKSDDPSRGASP